MNPVCSECKQSMEGTERAGLQLARKRGRKIEEGPGFIMHYQHAQEISSKLHKLEEMADGFVFMVNQKSDSSSKPKILGYLTLAEAKTYFPETEVMIN